MLEIGLDAFLDQKSSSVLHVILVKQDLLNIQEENVIPCNLAMHTCHSQNRAFWTLLSVQVCVSESLGTMQHLGTILKQELGWKSG